MINTAQWSHTTNFKLNNAADFTVKPDVLVLIGLDPALSHRKVFVSADQSSGNLDLTGILRFKYQGKITFTMPLSLQSGGALSATRQYTGGVFAPARDAATIDYDALAFQHVDTVAGALRNLQPIECFLTCDMVEFETLQINNTTGSGNMRLFLGVFSEDGSLI